MNFQSIKNNLDCFLSISNYASMCKLDKINTCKVHIKSYNPTSVDTLWDT